MVWYNRRYNVPAFCGNVRKYISLRPANRQARLVSYGNNSRLIKLKKYILKDRFDNCRPFKIYGISRLHKCLHSASICNVINGGSVTQLPISITCSVIVIYRIFFYDSNLLLSILTNFVFMIQ